MSDEDRRRAHGRGPRNPRRERPSSRSRSPAARGYHHASSHGPNGSNGSGGSGGSGGRGSNRENRPSGTRDNNNRPRGIAQGKRDRRPRLDIVKTNPLEQSKSVPKSEKTNVIQLASNHFNLSIRDWKIYQYSVTFEPDCELIRIKRGLLNAAMPEPTAKLLDGNVLRTNRRLEDSNLNLTATSTQGTEYKITLRFTKEEDYLSPGYHHVLNILMRQVLRRLNLQQVGRNFYDPQNPVRSLVIYEKFNLN